MSRVKRDSEKQTDRCIFRKPCKVLPQSSFETGCCCFQSTDCCGLTESYFYRKGWQSIISVIGERSGAECCEVIMNRLSRIFPTGTENLFLSVSHACLMHITKVKYSIMLGVKVCWLRFLQPWDAFTSNICKISRLLKMWTYEIKNNDVLVNDFNGLL